MMLLKKITNSWNAFLRKMRKLEELHKIEEKAELPFPTTGVIGAIAGDCFGAAYEFHPVKHGNFDIYKEPRFTDDTVMTLAVAKWLTSVSESIISYLEADSYTSAIRNAFLLVVMLTRWRVWLDMDDFTICWLYEWKKYGT